jgi:hypothetical protein
MSPSLAAGRQDTNANGSGRVGCGLAGWGTGWPLTVYQGRLASVTRREPR